MAQRFLARRGLRPRQTSPIQAGRTPHPARAQTAAIPAGSATTPTWTALGPAAVISPSYGLVSGRVSSLALDSSDPTGNKLYVGTTGGGVWVAQNAATATAGGIVFTPLTDGIAALSSTVDSSLSIGALSVQPGGTGVILAGTGDPNDALDSYYGAGILRSADGGATWTVIPRTNDLATGKGAQNYSFQGEGFAAFAWSTIDPQVVVAAVSQSIEGQLVAAEIGGASYKGLYYPSDSGATWHLSRISDGSSDVQGPLDGYALGNGSAATSVVWNPLRGLFIAAVRFHGYYKSADGITWTRLASQPGTGLSAAWCPTNPHMAGSPACPIFRGALAVNPLTGDTFAWTVDQNNQDQGLWQDLCAASGNKCTADLIFGKQWSTAPLQTDQPDQGVTTIANGDYNLALAAVPSGQDTLLLAGANDLWQCRLAMGCTWRNTTNSNSCMSAQVGEYQHAIEWNTANPLEVFVGNDSGLWRSVDAIGETGSACSAADASHWQNLNGGLGSLAEVESMSAVGATPYTMMLGLGANGTAGVKETSTVTQDWPQILSGEGGPVAIDPVNPNNWYVNNGAGVSIHLCSKTGPCTPADFGTAPVVSNASVSGDGLTMTAPAPFLVDPLDPTQLLIGTCRLWRGPASGVGWTAANAVMPMLDGNTANPSCSGDALIRSMAAMALPGGGEAVYVGIAGLLDGGATMAGHVLSANMNANGTWSAWKDLTFTHVINDPRTLNFYELDVSSVTVDPHDAMGNTVYVTVAGFQQSTRSLGVLYRSTDGGTNWTVIDGNLPWTPVNAVVVDPADTNTVYVATDLGVFSTQTVTTCGNSGGVCWAPYGAGLPLAPVVALSASPAGISPGVLVAGTYGRGAWQIRLLTSAIALTTVSASSGSLTFAGQMKGTASAPQTVTLTNTGPVSLLPYAVTASGDFSETDDCALKTIAPGASCSVQVVFNPTTIGPASGQLAIAANVQGGSILVSLAGAGLAPGLVALSPSKIDFGAVPVGTTSSSLSVTVANSGGVPVPITSLTVTGPFALSTNSCGTVSLAANNDCVLLVVFQPQVSGPATGALTMVDDIGTQTVQLAGTGTSPATDTLSAPSLGFPPTIIGDTSAVLALTVTNSGMNPLTSIQVSTTGPFIQSNTCGTQLAAQSRCSISVQFLPTAQGVQTGALIVADILTTQTVALSGTGLLPPVFGVSPSSLSFPAQQVAVSSAPQTLTVTNSGGAAMANVGFQIAGQQAASFTIGSTNCAALAVGANCTVQVIFTPAAAGTAAATLTITSSTSGVKAAVVPLRGTGQSASALKASPAQLAFEPTAIGQTTTAQIVTVTNPTSAPSDGLTLAVSGPFALVQNTCGSTLAAGAACTAGVVFSPMQSGQLTGTLTIRSTSPATATIVALSGTGGLTGALQILPAQLNFPVTGVGSTSSAITLTLTNTSTTVSLSGLALTASAGFKLSGGTCGTSLAATASCTVGVVFAPAEPGAQTGTLTLASSQLAANATVPLSGTGFDFTAAISGAGSKTVASGQTANYALTLTPAAELPGAFTLQCNSLPAYAACVFNPSTNSVAAGATGTEAVQITTSQASAMVVPEPNKFGWHAISLACGLMLLPLATRKRRRFLAAVALLVLAVGALSSCAGSGGGGGGAPTPTPSSQTVAPGTYLVSLVVTSNSVQHTVSLTLVVD